MACQLSVEQRRRLKPAPELIAVGPGPQGDKRRRFTQAVADRRVGNNPQAPEHIGHQGTDRHTAQDRDAMVGECRRQLILPPNGRVELPTQKAGFARPAGEGLREKRPTVHDPSPRTGCLARDRLTPAVAEPSAHGRPPSVLPGRATPLRRDREFARAPERCRPRSLCRGGAEDCWDVVATIAGPMRRYLVPMRAAPFLVARGNARQVRIRRQTRSRTMPPV